MSKLYHYSNVEREELKSLFAVGKEKEGYDYVRENPLIYTKSISFFLEPIPKDLPSLLKGEHSFWKKGVEFYEHEVSIKDLPKNVPYRLVESIQKTDLIYNKQDWDRVEKEPNLRKQYMEEIKELEESLFFHGNDLGNLQKAIRNAKADIRRDYINMYKLHKKHPEDNLMSRYASSVPHLMIYVAEIPVKVNNVKLIVLE